MIQSFLDARGMDFDARSCLEECIVEQAGSVQTAPDLIERIIGDAYDAINPVLKDISYEMQRRYGLYLGRIQKLQLKKYLDYGSESDLNKFSVMVKHSIPDTGAIEVLCEERAGTVNALRAEAVSLFLSNLKSSLAKADMQRVKDYLIFLYSRLLGLNELRSLSLQDIFMRNEKLIMKELLPGQYEVLKEKCSDKGKRPREETVRAFNTAYMQLLDECEVQGDANSMVMFVVDQQLRELFASKEAFLAYIFRAVREAYGRLQNHRTLAIHIKDVVDDGINIRWELVSWITIYAEKFLPFDETHEIYRPEVVCSDFMEHKYGKPADAEWLKSLKMYFEGDCDISASPLLSCQPGLDEELDNFRFANHGFEFADCLILAKDNPGRNSTELEFIKNRYELLLIFFKNKNDRRRIPCPVCGSLLISGNSFPEVGTRSWECKNPLCPERSKTNRGKRYSRKSILMQDGALDFSLNNEIPRSLIDVFRKDVVETWDTGLLYSMLVKYYSHPGDRVLSVNTMDGQRLEHLCLSQDRKCTMMSFGEFVEICDSMEEYADFADRNPFFRRFLYEKEREPSIPEGRDARRLHEGQGSSARFILGDATEVLESFPDNSVQHMVTSPPYYNAREYSEWKNLYTYLNDIYNIVLTARRKLVPGGVFFFNIGDIFGNENTIVRSKMGQKRIPLGAYMILLFEKAGFQVLDNVIWYKGETQSNRQKNDGIFAPYYQRPSNCYEHMLIFRKAGKLHLNSLSAARLLESDLTRFPPVIKIGPGGENRYGHSAPFPEMIPTLSISSFTAEGDTVLDPFSGSGTTAIAAAKLNRNGVGIELRREYVQLSIDRSVESGVRCRWYACGKGASD